MYRYMKSDPVILLSVSLFIVLFLCILRQNNFLDVQTTYQQAPAMAAGTTIIQTRPIQVGHNPVHCICPQCHQQIITRVDYVCINEIEKIFIHFSCCIGFRFICMAYVFITYGYRVIRFCFSLF